MSQCPEPPLAHDRSRPSRPRSVLRCRVGLLIGVAAIAFAAGCQSSTSDRDLVFVNSADDAQKLLEGRGSLITLGDRRKGVWVDPRPERKFNEKHIAGAVSLPIQNVERDWTTLREYGPVIVYGDASNSALAYSMAKELSRRGLKDVRIYRGGLLAWEQSGGAVEGTAAP